MTDYERYGRALLRKAERILQSRADAQDVVQSLFVDLLERTGTFDLPFLYRAVTNRCLSHLRDESNRARLREHHDEALRGTVRTRCDEHVIDMDMLHKLAETLDHGTLEIVICRYFDDMTQDEVATMLGISRKTVGKKLDDVRRAVATLAGEGASS